MNEWLEYVKSSGYTEKADDHTIFNFFQKSRLAEYRVGSFSKSLGAIRSDLNLRSTFFSVIADDDSITFKGRGYGHGVGLCQEGAMAMAAKGFSYSQIIDFYYAGVIISNIKNAVLLTPVSSLQIP